MAISRVAVLFDNQLRPETTGGYCLRALEEIVHVQHIGSYDQQQIPTSGFDLYSRIDDGMNSAIPVDLHPSAFWAIDAHLNFDRCLGHARTGDPSHPARGSSSVALLAIAA